MSGAREPYVVASTMGREVVARACESDLTARQLRTLMAVISSTVLYSKTSDRLYLAELARMAYGVEFAETWQVKKTGQDLRVLADKGLIDREPPRRGRPSMTSAPSYIIRVKGSQIGTNNEHADDEVGVSGERQVNGPESGPIMVPENGPDVGPKMVPGRVLKGAQIGTPTEKYSEEFSEEGSAPAPRGIEGWIKRRSSRSTDEQEAERRTEIHEAFADFTDDQGQDRAHEFLEYLDRTGRGFRFRSELQPMLDRWIADNPKPIVPPCDICNGTSWADMDTDPPTRCPACDPARAAA